MTYADKTLKILWGKSGGKCAFPGCNKDLIGDQDNIQGQICHIVAKKENGPRGMADYDGDLDDEGNLILFCAEHHKLVDDFPNQYTVELLRQYKKNHEDDVKNRMNIGQPWKVNFSQIYYMNIPRIEMLAAMQGIIFSGEVPKGRCLHSLGWDLNSLMAQVSGLMNDLSFNAASLNVKWDKLCVGQIVEINDKFRTKNVPAPDKVMKKRYSPTGDLQKDAHLYSNSEWGRRVLTIDPNWLATSTAFVNFSIGWVDVAGMGIVTYINNEEKIMLITPYVLGVPKTPYDDLFSSLL